MVRLDLDDFRTILDSAGVDVWTFIDTAMEVASLDYGNQLKNRRDGIVERLYALTSPPSRCRNCDTDRHHNGKPNGCEIKPSSPEPKRASPPTPQSAEGDGDGADPYAGLFDDEQKRVLEIKEQLEIPHQVFLFFDSDYLELFDCFRGISLKLINWCLIFLVPA